MYHYEVAADEEARQASELVEKIADAVDGKNYSPRVVGGVLTKLLVSMYLHIGKIDKAGLLDYVGTYWDAIEKACDSANLQQPAK